MLFDTDVGRRTAERRKLFQPASVNVLGQERRAHILDLSETGALVHSGQPPERNALVTLSCERVKVMGRVAWVDGSRFGLAFLRRVDAESVAALADCAGPRWTGGPSGS